MRSGITRAHSAIALLPGGTAGVVAADTLAAPLVPAAGLPQTTANIIAAILSAALPAATSLPRSATDVFTAFLSAASPSAAYLAGRAFKG